MIYDPGKFRLECLQGDPGREETGEDLAKVAGCPHMFCGQTLDPSSLRLPGPREQRASSNVILCI